MASKTAGGATSAVAASTHAACARFRGTDPLVVGRTRRTLAADIGFADDSGRIPEARWLRAMTFEHLVRDEKFVSEIATTTVGRLGLDRPASVVTANALVHLDKTATLLAQAHDRALADGAATLIHGLAIPFPGFEEDQATEVKPDFAVVAPASADRTWLIIGDAKDYERVRSRIQDARLLKGFLQVALGAEAAAAWARRPAGMDVHGHGVLAVPRNAFLQPGALVERLDDHRAEVRMRVAERRLEAELRPYDESQDLRRYVGHLRSTFDPASCPTCTLFSFCRNELRTSGDPADLLVELGIAADVRPQLIGLLDGTGGGEKAPASIVANVVATRDGIAQPTGQRRIDPAGLPGTVNVVIAKSDTAALGIHGIAVQRVTAAGREPWQVTVFRDRQSSPQTRREVMRLLGGVLDEAMGAQREANPEAPGPVHLVVPDPSTADVLASIADNLAGIELSRLRWEHDRAQGRTPLTFDGEPAEIPPALADTARVAVSFLLEEDRARALELRSPVVDLREALARHIVAGGPAVAAQRLDYLVGWAEADRLDARAFEDRIEAAEHTPGARSTSRRSDAIHTALVGSHGAPADPDAYDRLVTEELGYKCSILDRALDILEKVPDSALREVHRAIEADAQAVWRRRLALHASDLVRFGRTYRHWRNSLVPVIESDGKCRDQLLALGNPQIASDRAAAAGDRSIAEATVVRVDPLVLRVGSRRIGDESRIVLLHVNGDPCVERPDVELAVQKGSFKFTGLPIGPLSSTGEERQFEWAPLSVPELSAGDRLIVADFEWFSKNKTYKALNVTRPKPDEISSPKPTCEPGSYAEDPDAHQYCCRPHENYEADWADELAERRERGELNPQTWPPVVDADAFEVTASGAPTANSAAAPDDPVPDHLTMDDLE
ncbi:hypothetical protein NONO_c54580 [Nocardia nova SH22a]|uniref:Uncharacterized protein n=1 Tax=Nocardia nova SH22a TaxID=1415166 RepID=W5TML8_9NOCA|nr:hypothetical protein [Nocardia nova]AHH20238.1 hypothetical protein NONO_c54580 [Nocardia nova SH22a]